MENSMPVKKKRHSTEGRPSRKLRGADAPSEMSTDLITLERGPRKARRKGPAEPRISTHKSRSVWFQARAAWPVRDAPVRRLVEARVRSARAPRVSAAEEWENVGPSNIGCRTT